MNALFIQGISVKLWFQNKCIVFCATIFNELDVRVINNGFKKTKIEKFQSEETLEIEISREEELMNIIERMDKFRCDDSDDE